MTNRLPLALSTLVVAASTVAPLLAQSPTDEPDRVELRRLLIDRVEAAYTAGDTATLMRMAGMEPPPLTGRARTDQLLAEAKALLEQYRAYKPPPDREVRRARSALFELIDESTDLQVYAFYMLALERKELEEQGMKDVEAFDKMLRELDEDWEARAEELAGAPRGRVEPEEDGGF